ncbi:MAG TPA: HAMP domain-containing sensor histidine kinase [Nitrososphaeraceae archaeon]|nr:HAMP domain-containing sensor histidine kinase [Nitrososphaeraceae archaeon]
MMSSIEIKRKMMKLYRVKLLKKVYSTLLKLVTKTIIEEEGEEGEGIRSSSNIEIIRNPRESIKLAYDLIQSAEQEVLRIFPSIHAFRRQTRMGIMHLFKEVVEHGIKVRILIHADENQIRQVINEVMLVFPDIEIRAIDMSLNTSIGIVIVDKKESLIIETRDDAKDNSYDASGLATYSNSKYIALSYASIFESLWIQAELYKQLKEANEQLKQHDKMQKEFINLAAHELRTPIQPIIGFTEIVSSKIKDTDQRKLLDAVTRNAKRLQRLVDDIIDVIKIESQSLKLNKEELDLNHVITNIIDDYNTLIVSGNHKVKLYFNPFKETLLIKADKERISEVISNLLSNAIKFTKEDTIFISIEKREDDNNENNNYALVTVKDTGEGIDPEILPNMFSKFITKSFEGLGLGLYISQHIVKAHGGKIEGKNNANGIGAEFGFTLPLIKDSKTL